MGSLFGGQPGEQERGRIAVTVALVSGEILNGHMFVLGSSRLRDHINHADRFIEFEKRDGTITFLAKVMVGSITPLEIPRADQLQRKARDLAAFDPYTTLGIDRTAGPGEIRTAYWARARAYHPDKIAGLDMPKEVTDYMTASFMRIHAAYKELAGETPEAQPNEATRRAASAFREFA